MGMLTCTFPPKLYEEFEMDEQVKKRIYINQDLSLRHKLKLA